MAAADAALGEGPVVLVAHSAGGVVAAELARLAPDRVAGVLAVSAVVPGPGASFVSTLPAPQRWVLPLVMRLAGTRPPASAVRRGLAHGLDDAVVERLVADVVAESPRLFTERLAADLGQVDGPRGYLRTTADRELAPALQGRSADRLGASRRHDLATGHLPMLERPDAVAAAIEELAAECRGPVGR